MSRPTLLGLLLGVGLVLVVVSCLPSRPVAEAGDDEQATTRRPLTRDHAATLILAIAAFLAAAVCWAVFALPVLSVAAVAAVAVPVMVRRRVVRSGSEVTARDLGETAGTVARWIEGIRDYLSTASTLQDALVRASLDVRGPHARDFQRFASSVTGVGGFPAAAEELAGSLRSALADKALTALWIGGRDGGDIHTALTLLADSAQVEADNARRIEAGLAGTRRLVRLVSVLCLVILGMALFAFRDNFGVYRSTTGQLMLAAGLTVIAVSWWSIWRMSKIETPERLVSVRPVGGRGAQPW